MKKIVALAIAAAVWTSSAPASAQTVAGAFGKGRIHFVVTGGTGYAFDESYLVLGVGASYYLIDGLSAGVFLETWSGSDPEMYKVTTSLQYVFYRTPLKPYLGAFYRRTEIDRLPSLDSVGGRGGIHFQAGRNGHIGVGAVYESYLDCTESIYRSCDSFYPEVSFTLSF